MERAFTSPLWNQFEPGIYVDVRLARPHQDKFDSTNGLASFSPVVRKEVANYKEDHSHNMERIEVRSRVGDSHLGHVFPDGQVTRVVYAIVSMA